MVRARFSACRRKDAVFMAKTEAMREGKWQTTGPVVFVFQSVQETTTTSEFRCKSMQKYRITGSLYFDYFGLSPPPSNSGKCSIYRDTLLKIWCKILVVTVTGQETLLIHGSRSICLNIVGVVSLSWLKVDPLKSKLSNRVKAWAICSSELFFVGVSRWTEIAMTLRSLWQYSTLLLSRIFFRNKCK